MQNEPTPFPIDKARWAIVYSASILFLMLFQGESFLSAIGYSLPAFLIGLVIGAIVWATAKRSWQWHQWLNVGSYIGLAGILALSFLLPELSQMGQQYR